MWEIWAYELLIKALKSCPKSYKSPRLVTLVGCAVVLIKWYNYCCSTCQDMFQFC